ncbi:hypothetical protein Tco_0238011 [Tanacetum coccineum]
MQEFASEYYIPKSLHPELPGPKDNIVDFPEGKVGVYTKFFEFANSRIPISQFLFDILGHFQIHLSQLSVIGAAKVSHFKINCRIIMANVPSNDPNVDAPANVPAPANLENEPVGHGDGFHPWVGGNIPNNQNGWIYL